MNFAFESRFRIVEDVQPSVDPWGFGIILKILRYGSTEHQKWLKDRQRKDPLLSQVSAELIREQLEEYEVEPPRELKIVGAPPDPGAEEAAAADRAEDWRKKSMRAFRKAAIAQLDKDPDAALARFFDNTERLEEAISLLKGWDHNLDENGDPIPFTAETVRAMLTIDSQVPEGYGEGLSAGEALINFLFERSKAASVERQKYLEAAEKNSEASSVGA